MRKDKAKSLAKVAKSRLNDPLKTVREVEKETWVDHVTVSRRDKELKQTGTKDDRILWICDKDINIVKLAQGEIVRRLWDDEEKKQISARDLSWIAKDSSARYTIFKWEVTDSNGWMKSLKDLSTEELLKMYNDL